MLQLRRLSDGRSHLTNDTMEKLEDAPILLGCLQETFGMSDHNFETDEEKQYADDLLRQNEVHARR